MDPDTHDFIFGDVFQWLKRFRQRGQQWDIVLLDPPTFSTTRQGRVFRAGRDYPELVSLAAGLVRDNGWLFCSTNQRSLAASRFQRMIQEVTTTCRRAVGQKVFLTQPFDFPTAESESPYLKTVWLRYQD